MRIKISSEAQALIDRLARMDLANPRQDKAAIEQAITAHLAALGLPERPFIWAKDGGTGSLSIIERGAFAVRRAAREAAEGADDSAWEAVWPAWKRAKQAARTDIWLAVTFAVTEAAWDHAAGRLIVRDHVTVWDAAFDFEWAHLPVSVRPDDDATYKAIAGDAAWKSILVAPLPAFDHPAIAKYLSVELPMFDAFEAGLYRYWITPRDVICVLQPSLAIENGRLHRANSPAISWPSGEAYYFWRGVNVPAWMIEEPGRISVAAIRAEENQEVRRCMTEIYGLARYLKASNARLIHEDEYGKLWDAQIGDEAWGVVEVENGTPEPDGTYRVHTLDVTGAAAVLGWPIETARAAVAATYALREEEYCPEVRT